ncbi:aconitate hydratase [compost metagenome]
MIERATEDGKNEVVEVAVACRLDTEEEVHVYEAGGVLQRFAQDFLEGNVA